MRNSRRKGAEVLVHLELKHWIPYWVFVDYRYIYFSLKYLILDLYSKSHMVNYPAKDGLSLAQNSVAVCLQPPV